VTLRNCRFSEIIRRLCQPLGSSAIQFFLYTQVDIPEWWFTYPIRLISFLQIVSPSPQPFLFWWWVFSILPNSLNSDFWSSSLMPGPSSVTQMNTMSAGSTEYLTLNILTYLAISLWAKLRADSLPSTLNFFFDIFWFLQFLTSSILSLTGCWSDP